MIELLVHLIKRKALADLITGRERINASARTRLFHNALGAAGLVGLTIGRILSELTERVRTALLAPEELQSFSIAQHFAMTL